jgi:hypothetical protein
MENYNVVTAMCPQPSDPSFYPCSNNNVPLPANESSTCRVNDQPYLVSVSSTIPAIGLNPRATIASSVTIIDWTEPPRSSLRPRPTAHYFLFHYIKAFDLLI